ncbi:response regulator [Gemmatimonadota bacterium]
MREWATQYARQQTGRPLSGCMPVTPTDLVITDIYMPEMNGIEFLIRVWEAFPEARVIALSGGGFLGKEDVLAAASKLGAVGVLKKPFSAEECLEVVQRALDTAERGTAGEAGGA